MVNFHFMPTLEVFNNWFKENSEWNNFSHLTAAAVSGNIKRDYNHRFLGGDRKERQKPPKKGLAMPMYVKHHLSLLILILQSSAWCWRTQVFALYRSVCIVILSVRSTVNETLMKECKWGGELAGKERGKCSEEGHDLKENISHRQKNKRCVCGADVKVNTWVMSEQGKQTQHKEGWSDWIGMKRKEKSLKKEYGRKVLST